jgi:hypothetical protein
MFLIMNNFAYTTIPITNTMIGYNPFISTSSPMILSNNTINISDGYTFTIANNPSINTTSYPIITSNIGNYYIEPHNIETNKSEQQDLSQYTDCEATEHDTACIICMSNKRQIVLNPCGHYNMCIGCTDKIIQDTSKCPVCQKEIISAIKIFE